MSPRGLPGRSEHDEQCLLMQWAALSLTRYPELGLLYAVPNGGHRHPATAGRLRAEGVKRGVPDLCLPVARGGNHGLYLELKAGKNRLTPEQRAWLDALRAQGYRAECVTGWEAARDLLLSYLDS